jgi:hypothetical protein
VGRVVQAVIVALITLAGSWSLGASTTGGADSYPLVIGATTCERAPARLSQLGAADCRAAAGVTIEARSESGERLGTCTTEPSLITEQIATCSLLVPSNTPVYVYEVESTIPSASVPLAQPLFERTPPSGVMGHPPQFFINVPLAQSLPAATPTQQGTNYSITLRLYTCPPGLSAQGASSSQCSPVTSVTKEYAIVIASLEGVAQPLALTDATLVDGAYVWGNDAIVRRGLFGRLDIAVTSLPQGYADVVVRGNQIAFDAVRHKYLLRLSPDAPQAEVAIFAVAPLRSTPRPRATDDTAFPR